MRRRFDDAESLDGAVRQAVGAASICWQSVDRAGVFQDGRANEVADELLASIRSGRWPVTTPVTIADDAEMFHGLTIWADAVSVQVRDTGVALHVMADAPRYTGEDQEPVLVDLAAARKIRDLLNVATARGCL